nr:unnamed protein product [Naegleria fowleri]
MNNRVSHQYLFKQSIGVFTNTRGQSEKSGKTSAYIGQARGGSSLKDRGSGTVIRYNFVKASVRANRRGILLQCSSRSSLQLCMGLWNFQLGDEVTPTSPDFETMCS